MAQSQTKETCTGTWMPVVILGSPVALWEGRIQRCTTKPSISCLSRWLGFTLPTAAQPMQPELSACCSVIALPLHLPPSVQCQQQKASTRWTLQTKMGNYFHKKPILIKIIYFNQKTQLLYILNWRQPPTASLVIFPDIKILILE